MVKNVVTRRSLSRSMSSAMAVERKEESERVKTAESLPGIIIVLAAGILGVGGSGEPVVLVLLLVLGGD